MTKQRPWIIIPLYTAEEVLLKTLLTDAKHRRQRPHTVGGLSSFNRSFFVVVSSAACIAC